MNAPQLPQKVREQLFVQVGRPGTVNLGDDYVAVAFINPDTGAGSSKGHTRTQFNQTFGEDGLRQFVRDRLDSPLYSQENYTVVFTGSVLNIRQKVDDNTVVDPDEEMLFTLTDISVIQAAGPNERLDTHQLPESPFK